MSEYKVGDVITIEYTITEVTSKKVLLRNEWNVSRYADIDDLKGAATVRVVTKEAGE